MNPSTLEMQSHSPAWIFQTWASFALATAATALGIIFLQVPPWTRAFLAMGLLFTVGSTLNLAKTTRDLHEAKRLHHRVDEARVEKLLADHHPLK